MEDRIMLDEESLTRVFEVPINPIKGSDGKYNYEKTKYSPDYQWTDEDKNKLESVIDRLVNDLEFTLEEKVIITGGEVIIRCEVHPKDEKKDETNTRFYEE